MRAEIHAGDIANEPHVGKLARWVLPPISGVALICILSIVALRSSLFLGDSDTGWHIRAGDLILQTSTVPHHDVFSYTMPGRDWFAWEWLTDILMSVIHHHFGLAGITSVTVVVLFLSYALLLRNSLLRGSDVFVASALTIFAAWASMLHWLARPHILSILLLLCWTILVENWRRHRFTNDRRAKLIYGLPLLIALWANLHGGFVVTFPMLVIYAAGEALEFARRGTISTPEFRSVLKTYLKIAGASTAASLATPYGIRLYSHLWAYVTDNRLLASINEFQSPNFHNVAGKSIEVLLFCAAVAFVRTVVERRYVEAGLLLFWAHLALQSLRHVPLAAVVMVPIIAEHWSVLLREFAHRFRTNPLLKLAHSRHRGFTAIDRRLNGALTYVSIAGFLVVLITGGSPRLNEVMDGKFDAGRLPVAAADFIASSKPAGNVYSSDQFGGYLIYRFYPEMKVFIDGRSDFYRTGSVVDDYLKIASLKPEWASLLDKYEVRWMLLQPKEALATVALTSGKWSSVYCDDTAQVLVRP